MHGRMKHEKLWDTSILDLSQTKGKKKYSFEEKMKQFKMRASIKETGFGGLNGQFFGH